MKAWKYKIMTNKYVNDLFRITYLRFKSDSSKKHFLLFCKWSQKTVRYSFLNLKEAYHNGAKDLLKLHLFFQYPEISQNIIFI